MDSHIRITNIDTSTPHGLAQAFHEGVTECALNAEALDNGPTANLTGHYMITLHAIELGLKAFLAKSGLTEDQLSKNPYGHDLASLYSEAVKRGLCVNVPGIEKTLNLLNVYHHKRAILRYDFATTRELPLCRDLFPIISALAGASK
jgi:hypothetical protein